MGKKHASKVTVKVKSKQTSAAYDKGLAEGRELARSRTAASVKVREAQAVQAALPDCEEDVSLPVQDTAPQTAEQDHSESENALAVSAEQESVPEPLTEAASELAPEETVVSAPASEEKPEAQAPPAPEEGEAAQQTRKQKKEKKKPECEPEKVNADSKPRTLSKWSELSKTRKIIVLLFALFTVYSFLPILGGIMNIGVYAPAAIGIFGMLVTLAWRSITSKKNVLWSALCTLIALIIMAGAVTFAYVSGEMISASRHYAPAYNSKVTVVVLGCKINGTEPSLMLQRRLEAAADYLLKNPGTNCVVTGGQGADEPCPEAVVMKQRLVEMGVSASRIKTEDESTSTRENLINAMKVIKENNYYSNICVVTDGFHQLRASMICDDLGITSHYAISSDTPWYLVFCYWFREMFGLARLWLLGY